ncbi:hypothetical protein [Rhizobium paknamense]|uniref:Carboxypeptidase regulatory-like domain-containing protein n=1 Tax=Rhizobium paknamense TaxID=1206817 RepID=A0ABU0I8V5_9HYPH|nr:hypothetical protein [Rhizobium paknamense]MDQ0454666.1 hypothetical protein [Rhizobium paknamense]
MIVCHTNGTIFNVLSDPIPEGMAEHLSQQGISFIEVESTESAQHVCAHYHVFEGCLNPLQEMDLPAAITLQPGGTTVFDGLPDPCTVAIDDEAQTVSGGHLEFEAADAGTYLLVFTASGYRPRTVEVTVDEAAA